MEIKPLTENPLLARLVELAFAKAKKRFPYWATGLNGLTPLFVDIPETSKHYSEFSFAVTSGGTMLVSDLLVRSGWTPEACGTVIVHEMLHIYSRHEKRAKAHGVNLLDPIQAEAWNLATDAEINDDLRDAGCVFPTGEDGAVLGVFPEGLGCEPYLTAEEYFTAWMSAPEDQKPGDLSARRPFTATGCGGGQGSPTEVERQFRDQLSRDEADASTAGAGTPDEGEDQKPAPDDSPEVCGWDKTPEEMESIIEEMTDSLLSAEDSNPGSTPGRLSTEAKRRRVGTVDWRTALASTVRRACTDVRGGSDAHWGRPARRQLGQFLRPSMTKRAPRVVVALDTSGSMAQMMGDALAQVEPILDVAGAKVTYMQADASVAQVLEVRTAAEAMAAGIKGWGGTDFRPVFNEVATWPPQKRPHVLIYLTDGEGPAPTTAPPYRVIWAVVGTSGAPAKWGTEIRIPRGG